MQLKRIKRVDYENEYEDVPFLPPRAESVTGPHRVGDFVEMTDHGYIKARYRLVDGKGSLGTGLCPDLFA